MLEEKKPIELGQQSFLIELLKDKPEHFRIWTDEQLWEATKQLTEKQYKYILYLIFNNKYFKAKEIISQKMYDKRLKNQSSQD